MQNVAPVRLVSEPRDVPPGRDGELQKRAPEFVVLEGLRERTCALNIRILDSENDEYVVSTLTSRNTGGNAHTLFLQGQVGFISSSCYAPPLIVSSSRSLNSKTEPKVLADSNE